MYLIQNIYLNEINDKDKYVLNLIYNIINILKKIICYKILL